MNNFVEINNEDLVETNGGGVLTVFAIAAGIIAVAEGINICYDLGKNIGEAIYYATH